MAEELETPATEQVSVESPTSEVVSPLPASEATTVVSEKLPDPKITDTPDEDEDDFVSIVEKDAPAPAKKLSDYYKDLDEDIDSEEKFVERAKEYKQKANEFKTLAESDTLIKDDNYIKNWTAHIEAEDEALVQSALIAKGLTKEKAEERINKWKESTPDRISEEAEDLRIELKGLIKSRTTQIQQHISETRKALTLSDKPDPAHLNKTIEALSKTDNFLGLKIGGKSEQSKKDFLKPVMESIKDGSALKELQSNPSLLAEFALFRQYKSQFKKAVENRIGATKKSQLEKLKDAPHSSGAASPRPVDRKAADTGGIKDVDGFLGKKK